MKLLCLDSSGPVCSVALVSDGNLLGEFAVSNGNTHSQHMMPLVDGLLSTCGMTLSDIDLFACVVGPGSFTGVRLGVASVKAMAHALGKNVVPVAALEALGQAPFAGTVCPILDARRNQVYTAAFVDGKRVFADSAMDIFDYAKTLANFPAPYLFVGDGVEAYRCALSGVLGGKAVFAGAASAQLRAGQAALWAWAHQDKAIPGDELEPLYLRASQAEREYAQKHGGVV